MKAIGRYRWTWAGGEQPLTTTSPFYGKRRVGLLSVKAEMTQILVYTVVGLMWINMPESHLEDT